jgi:ribosome-associated toxin RatA of RatAB toxin-antitoxin module
MRSDALVPTICILIKTHEGPPMFSPALCSTSALRSHASRRARRHWLLPASAVIAWATASAAPALIDVRREQSSLRVQASATLQVDAQTVWDTLVAYEQLPEFIPDMVSSRTVRRDGVRAVVEQHGRAGLGVFKQAFGVTLAVQELPLREVNAQAIAGDFSRFEASYRLYAGSDGGTRIDYTALIEPKARMLPVVGVPVLRLAIHRQFEAMVAEIERRAARAAAPPEKLL